MVFESTRHDGVYVTCSCGCGEGVEIRLCGDDDPGDPFVWIHLTQHRWYAEQDTGFQRIKKKARKIWAVLRNKDICYSELSMTASEFDAFRALLNQMKTEAGN